MSQPKGLSFGGFLIGIGTGWFLFQNLEVTNETFSWGLILFGLTIVASNLFKRFSPEMNLGGLVSGVTFGLIVALVMTNGFSIFTGSDLFNNYDYHVDDPRSFTGSLTSDQIAFSSESVNGDITVSTWNENTYMVLVTVTGKGTSENDATSILTEAVTKLDDSKGIGTQELILTIDITQSKWNRFEVDIEISLPEGITLDLDVETTNGNIRVEDILGEDISTITTNGDLRFVNVNASSITGRTTNGGIYGTFDASDMSGRSTNGNININIYSDVSGEYDLSTTNGNVNVDVKESENAGFKLAGSLTNGQVSFGLNDLNYNDNTSKNKTAQSEDYTSSSIQIEIEASTTSGDIDIT